MTSRLRLPQSHVPAVGGARLHASGLHEAHGRASQGVAARARLVDLGAPPAARRAVRRSNGLGLLRPDDRDDVAAMRVALRPHVRPSPTTAGSTNSNSGAGHAPSDACGGVETLVARATTVES